MRVPTKTKLKEKKIIAENHNVTRREFPIWQALLMLSLTNLSAKSFPNTFS